jgi:hypothetical protein
MSPRGALVLAARRYSPRVVSRDRPRRPSVEHRLGGGVRPASATRAPSRSPRGTRASSAVTARAARRSSRPHPGRGGQLVADRCRHRRDGVRLVPEVRIGAAVPACSPDSSPRGPRARPRGPPGRSPPTSRTRSRLVDVGRRRDRPVVVARPVDDDHCASEKEAMSATLGSKSCGRWRPTRPRWVTFAQSHAQLLHDAAHWATETTTSTTSPGQAAGVPLGDTSAVVGASVAEQPARPTDGGCHEAAGCGCGARWTSLLPY